FMPTTARQYGLEVNDNVDERYNLEKATEAACRFLNDAYKRYGNWESVAASYNAGMGRITDELNRQGQDTSFDLYLNDETSRYVFRIFAMKLILENPRKYGFLLKPEQLYYPTPTREIEVKGPISDLPTWAINNGTSYQWVKELNPWLRTRSLPNKTSRTYKIKVPADSASLSRRSTTKQPIYNRNFVSEK
ncbi:MAG: lytic transglycosylase domain-containing protein, partial [Muribaculaceae bacterium]|nr:lytic transglycosylase domain-containing protein [Muribaculaceae bacterium]